MFNFLLFSFFLSGWLGADRRWRWGGAWGPPPQISVGRNTSFLTQRQAFFTFSVFVFLFYLLWSLWGATPPSWHNAKHFLLFLFFSSSDLSGMQHFLLCTTRSIFYFFFPPSISVGRNTSFLTQRQAFFTFSVFVFLFYLLWSLWGATPPSWHNAKHFLLFLFFSSSDLSGMQHFLLCTTRSIFYFFFPPSISVGRNTSFLTQRWAFFTFSVFCFSFFPPSISLGRNTSLLTRPGAFFYFFCFCFVFFPLPISMGRNTSFLTQPWECFTFCLFTGQEQAYLTLFNPRGGGGGGGRHSRGREIC